MNPAISLVKGSCRHPAFRSRRRASIFFWEFITKTNDVVTQLSYELGTSDNWIQAQEADWAAAEAELGQTEARLADLSAKLATPHDKFNVAVTQRTEEKFVFDVNVKDLCESVDVLQKVIDIVPERFDTDGQVLLQRVSKTEPAMHRVTTTLLRE